MGYISDSKDVVVTSLIHAGPKAKRTKWGFRPDPEFQNKGIADQYEASGRHERYLGDWHKRGMFDDIAGIKKKTPEACLKMYRQVDADTILHFVLGRPSPPKERHREVGKRLPVDRGIRRSAVNYLITHSDEVTLMGENFVHERKRSVALQTFPKKYPFAALAKFVFARFAQKAYFELLLRHESVPHDDIDEGAAICREPTVTAPRNDVRFHKLPRQFAEAADSYGRLEGIHQDNPC